MIATSSIQSLGTVTRLVITYDVTMTAVASRAKLSWMGNSGIPESPPEEVEEFIAVVDVVVGLVVDVVDVVDGLVLDADVVEVEVASVDVVGVMDEVEALAVVELVVAVVVELVGVVVIVVFVEVLVVEVVVVDVVEAGDPRTITVPVMKE